jgi:3-phosphoshikimate 1-carboxyvinyltransferase
MMAAFKLRCETVGNKISVVGGQIPQVCDIKVPGDISSAAFWLVAAAAMPGSRLVLQDVGLNPTRTAILKVLSRMGADLTEISHASEGEPIGHVEIQGAALRGTTLLAEEIPNLIDEIPVIAVAAALATGETHIRGARELRVKETDRITTTVENLRKMGVDVEEFEDGMLIRGGNPLQGAAIESHGDHRIAMAFCIAGLFAKGETVVSGTDCINTSYPGFSHHLNAIQHEKTKPEDFNLPIVLK